MAAQAAFGEATVVMKRGGGLQRCDDHGMLLCCRARLLRGPQSHFQVGYAASCSRRRSCVLGHGDGGRAVIVRGSERVHGATVSKMASSLVDALPLLHALSNPCRGLVCG